MPRGSHAIRHSVAGALAPERRRSSGRRCPADIRQTANDNFLVVVMLETMESIINADEIANTFGLDVVIQGNSDLSQFSGWSSDRRALRGAVDHQPQRDAEGGQVLGQRRSAVSDGPSVEPVDALRAERTVARRIRVPGARTRSAGASKIASQCQSSAGSTEGPPGRNPRRPFFRSTKITPTLKEHSVKKSHYAGIGAAAIAAIALSAGSLAAQAPGEAGRSRRSRESFT